jgi:lysozyme
MKLSEEGLSKIILWEGFRSHVYKDAAGLPTIGVGHLLTRDELSSGKINIEGCHVKYSGGLSQLEIRQLLFRDVANSERTVTDSVNVELAQHQFDTLVSFVFNVGSSAFRNSTLRRRLNAEKYTEVPSQLMRWTYACGKKLRGLENRRSNEIKVWEGSYA